MPGPAPTPTAKLKLTGSWRAGSRDRKDEPKPKRGEPTKPGWLTGVASEAWDTVVPMLLDLHVLTVIDANALAVYCRTWELWRECDAFIAEHGATYPVYQWVPNPVFEHDATQPRRIKELKLIRRFPQAAQYVELADRLLKYEREFGLTPSARTRIQVEKAGTGSSPSALRQYAQGG